MKWTNENRIKFYSYYFFNVEKPVVIEARNRMQARDTIEEILPTLPPKYSQNRIVGETVSTPLVGITTKKIKGIVHVWGGDDKGWVVKN